MINLDLEIAKNFNKSDYVVKGESLYITSNKAIEFSKICKDQNIVILGLDGFIIDDKGTTPLSDYSTDYSMIEESDWDHWVIRSYNATLNFLNFVEPKKNLFFCFALEAKSQE